MNINQALTELDTLLRKATTEGCTVAESNRMRAALEAVIQECEGED